MSDHAQTTILFVHGRGRQGCESELHNKVIRLVQAAACRSGTAGLCGKVNVEVMYFADLTRATLNRQPKLSIRIHEFVDRLERRLRCWLLWFMTVVCYRLGCGRRLIEWALPDVNEYWNNSRMRRAIHRRFLQQLWQPLVRDRHRVIIVAHSLGTQITCEVLGELARFRQIVQNEVELITLGSPLGDPNVRTASRCIRRSLIRSWVNISAEYDHVATDPQLDSHFPSIPISDLLIRQPINADLSPHSLDHYFSSDPLIDTLSRKLSLA